MKLYHYYHVYADADGWEDIVLEHFEALVDSGLYAKLAEPVKMGVVGTPENRFAVFALMSKHNIPVHQVNVGPSNWEQATLYAMWWRAKVMRGAVLYAHTKGVAHPSVRQDEWRRRMTELVVGQWSSCIDALELLGVDVVGAYRMVNYGNQAFAGDGADIVAADLNRELGTNLDAGKVFPQVGEAIFMGNFWWADWEWIASLNAPLLESRYDAETWVGNANAAGNLPTAYNMERWIPK